MARSLTDHPDRYGDSASPAAEAHVSRSLIETLIADTRLYSELGTTQELLDFVSRLRAVAPFNAMLLHTQKPGITHVATARDWRERFGRTPKPSARPLVILRHRGPVDFVFDVLDTDGRELPSGAFVFETFGNLTQARLQQAIEAATSERFHVTRIDVGDRHAGRIWITERSRAPKGRHLYAVEVNRNHSLASQLVTIAHELAHALLGHLGQDPGRGVPDRSNRPHALQEVEAECVAYLVARRNGLKPRSETYLREFRGAFTDLNLHAVMRAANGVEAALGVSAYRLWEGA